MSNTQNVLLIEDWERIHLTDRVFINPPELKEAIIKIESDENKISEFRRDDKKWDFPGYDLSATRASEGE